MFLIIVTFSNHHLCPQAASENGLGKKSNATGKIDRVLISTPSPRRWQTPVLTRFSSRSLLRCGVPAAPAAFAKGPGRRAFTSHQGSAGGAAAGRRSTGGVPGPDAPHPPSPAGRLCSTHRNIAHTHSGQQKKVYTKKHARIKSFLICRN